MNIHEASVALRYNWHRMLTRSMLARTSGKYWRIDTKELDPAITAMPPSNEALDFARGYTHISIQDLEDILEELEDRGYLSPKGKKLHKEFWKLFIRIDDDKIKFADDTEVAPASKESIT